MLVLLRQPRGSVSATGSLKPPRAVEASASAPGGTATLVPEKS
jgi:hypothetical protein